MLLVLVWPRIPFVPGLRGKSDLLHAELLNYLCHSQMGISYENFISFRLAAFNREGIHGFSGGSRVSRVSFFYVDEALAGRVY